MNARAILLATFVLATSGATGAAPISVPNPSFEDPDLADGTRANALNFDTVTVPGWASSFAGPPVSGGGLEDPSDLQFAGATGNASPLPGTAQGSQATFLQGTLASNSQSFSTTLPVAILEADTTYTLTVAIGNPLDSEPGDVLLEFIADGSRTAETVIPAGTLPDGTFTDHELVLVLAPGDPLDGAELDLRVRQEQTENALQTVYFDHVRLEDTAVPEPVASALLAIGFAVLAGAARRHPRS
ncbi:MAG: hypothetical protein ACR2PQ_08905 [Myxococcota bacterium]